MLTRYKFGWKDDFYSLNRIWYGEKRYLAGRKLEGREKKEKKKDRRGRYEKRKKTAESKKELRRKEGFYRLFVLTYKKQIVEWLCFFQNLPKNPFISCKQHKCSQDIRIICSTSNSKRHKDNNIFQETVWQNEKLYDR